MELKQILSTLVKWSWLIVLATLVAAVSSLWASGRMPRLYRTTTTLMVGQFIQSANPQANELWASQQLAQSYVQIVARQPVLQATVDALGLDIPWDALAGQVSAAPIAGTQLMQISVVDTDPQRAKVLADEIAHQLILQSPTTPDQDQERRREFVNQQLADLEKKIEDAKGQVDELEKRLALETSARGIQDTQSQMGGLQQKITAWQTNYANLLEFYRGSRVNYLSVVEPARLPNEPFSPRTGLNVLLAAAIGCLLAVGAAFLLEYLDDTLKTGEDVERVLELPTLGAISRIQKVAEPADNLVALRQPRSPIAEGYRILRTNVQFTCLSDAATRLLVTSAGPGEGKTTTSCNLGVTMAQGGKRVLVVDTDLRRPSVHRFFGVLNQAGLTSLLLDEDLPLDAVLVETEVAGLRVLPSGPLPPNPAELLGSERMRRRVEELEQQADVVIFDSPPVLAVADASILGALCSGVILVVDAGRTRSEVARRAAGTLTRVGLKVLGVTLNKLSSRRSGGYYYYYDYSGDGERRRVHRNGSGPRARGLGRFSAPAALTKRPADPLPAAPGTEDRPPSRS